MMEINSFIKGNNNKPLPSKLIDEGNNVTDARCISNVFNHYFVNIGPTLSANTNSGCSSFKNYLLPTVSQSLFMTP